MYCTLTIVICWIFFGQLNAMDTSAAVEEKQADLQLVTPDDYAVEIAEIEEAYNIFKQ